MVGVQEVRREKAMNDSKADEWVAEMLLELMARGISEDEHFTMYHECPKDRLSVLRYDESRVFELIKDRIRDNITFIVDEFDRDDAHRRMHEQR